MKKNIALMGKDYCFESIVKKVQDTNITFIADDANSDIFQKAKLIGASCKYIPPEELASHFAATDYNLIVLTDMNENIDDDVLTLGKFVNMHPSLLPAFKGNDAIQRAFLAGVKVSGITIHWVNSEIDGGKIITQYPVLIGNSTHYDEFKSEIIKTANMLYPIVIDKLLRDEVFDFNDLAGGCCSHSCTGCNNNF